MSSASTMGLIKGLLIVSNAPHTVFTLLVNRAIYSADDVLKKREELIGKQIPTFFDSTNYLINTVKIMKFISVMALVIFLFSVQVAEACDKEGPWSEVWIEVWVPPEVMIVDGFHFEIGDGHWEWQLSGYRDPCGYFHFADQMMHDPGGQ